MSRRILFALALLAAPAAHAAPGPSVGAMVHDLHAQAIEKSAYLSHSAIINKLDRTGRWSVSVTPTELPVVGQAQKQVVHARMVSPGLLEQTEASGAKTYVSGARASVNITHEIRSRSDAKAGKTDGNFLPRRVVSYRFGLDGKLAKVTRHGDPSYKHHVLEQSKIDADYLGTIAAHGMSPLPLE